MRFGVSHRAVRRGGFSLIELLVVIGIIAVLLGILFPTLRNVRLDGQRIKCAAQLHQLGIALVAYSTNYRGALPSWSSWQVAGGNGTGEDAPGLGWTEELAPYFTDPRSTGAGGAGRVYDCPSFPRDYRINYFLAARWSHLCGRSNMSFHDIKLSSEFVLSGDCTGPSLYRLPFGDRMFTTDDCDKDDAVAPALLFFGEPGRSGGRNIHRGGNNVLFGDSHVALEKKFDMTSMTFDPHRMAAWADVRGEDQAPRVQASP